MNQENHILLFDGVCNLCNSMVQFIIKRDPKGKFKFASLQSEAGQAVLKKSGLPTKYFDSVVFIYKGKYFLKSNAVLQVLKALGGVWTLFYIFIFIPRPLRDFIYKGIAKTRYKFFGKRSVCMVPNQEILNRFL